MSETIKQFEKETGYKTDTISGVLEYFNPEKWQIPKSMYLEAYFLWLTPKYEQLEFQLRNKISGEDVNGEGLLSLLEKLWIKSEDWDYRDMGTFNNLINAAEDQECVAAFKREMESYHQSQMKKKVGEIIEELEAKKKELFNQKSKAPDLSVEMANIDAKIDVAAEVIRILTQLTK